MKDFKISIRYTDTNENLSRYFTEVNKHKMLSPNEEAELAFKARNGDQSAKDQIIKSNLRFVITVAKSYASRNSPLEDLISEGNKGLIEAMDVFDPSTGFKFISYAVWHIRKNIFLYLNQHSRIIKLPQSVLTQMKKIERVQDHFLSSTGRDGSVREIVEIMQQNGMDIPSEKIIEILDNKPVGVALDTGNSSENEALSPIDWLKSDENSDHLIFNIDDKEVVSQILPHLNQIERKVIEMRYGLGETTERTYYEIGNYFERTPEWARLVHQKALKRMSIVVRRKKIEYPSR